MTRRQFRCEFPAEPASAGEARRFVLTALAETGVAGLSDTAMLLVSELVSNAVLHAGTPIEVDLEIDDGSMRLEVHDGSDQMPVRKNYSTLSGTGRGLRMVERMATAWGADAEADGGKVVWCRIDADGQPRPAFDLAEVDAL